MRVTEAFKNKKPALSFEFFPPKTAEQEKRLFEVIAQLKNFRPDFASVTYGALGTTREKTFFWAHEIKTRYGIEPVAHLTCVAASRDDIVHQLDELESMDVKNILALRGDPPAGTTDFSPPPDGFKLAKELIAFIKAKKPGFCLGAAGFPEGHPAAPDQEKDVEYLKLKIEAGAEFVITQLFFDNRFYFDYLERCGQKGINVPIIPGLMPITSLAQIRKMIHVCGATIPPHLLEKLEEVKNDPESTRQLGAEHTLAQARELLNAGVPGLHFFVLNQAEPISAVLNELKL